VAIPYAGKRGQVMRFLPCPWYVGDFMISGPGSLTIVCLRLARRFRARVAEIQEEYSKPVDGLRTIPSGGFVSLELWLYSRNGALRFFRVSKAGLEEIDYHGDIFVEGKSAIVTQKNPGNPDPFPGGTIATAESCSGISDTRNPILRWLAKRNAAKKAMAGETGPGSTAEPVKKNKEANKGRAVKKKSPVSRAATVPEVPVADGPGVSPDDGHSVGELIHTPEQGNSRGVI
jgi:hypothetical protein